MENFLFSFKARFKAFQAFIKAACEKKLKKPHAGNSALLSVLLMNLRFPLLVVLK